MRTPAGMGAVAANIFNLCSLWRQNSGLCAGHVDARREAARKPNQRWRPEQATVLALKKRDTRTEGTPRGYSLQM